jgi:hypothetical protein
MWLCIFIDCLTLKPASIPIEQPLAPLLQIDQSHAPLIEGKGVGATRSGARAAIMRTAQPHPNPSPEEEGLTD